MIASPQVTALVDALRRGNVVVLTGAGVSTESGIPDYRSPEALARPRRPITGPEFLRSPALRQRYWARAFVGWERFRYAVPGPAHHAITALQRAGVVRRVVTQNVDRLHSRAGTARVIELHGALAEVICLACSVIEDREAVQTRMHEANATWLASYGAAAAAPDGDADLGDEAIDAFQRPRCVACGGDLKPRVVFFGENVAPAIVEEAYREVDAATGLLVVGTSLAVFSGYRFLRRAAERGAWIGIVNRGPVRGEEHAALKIEESTGAVLSLAAGMLAGAPPSRDGAITERVEDGGAIAR